MAVLQANIGKATSSAGVVQFGTPISLDTKVKVNASYFPVRSTLASLQGISPFNTVD